MSGTGKSTIIRDLCQRGFSAIDMDEPGWSIWDRHGHQTWLEQPLQAALDNAKSNHLFVSGCAENQVKFYPRFDHIVLLTAPLETLKARLSSRSDNHYGQRPEELAYVLEQMAHVEPLLRQSATLGIDGTLSIEQIANIVLRLLK
jgi:dephospho-CoA kinase